MIAIDLVFAFLILLMTYAISSEGLWGAALMFFNVLFGGLIAFNFYEPLAKLIDSTGIGWGFSDSFSLLAIFCLSVLLLRMTTETLAPAMVRFPTPVYHAGRLIFALATSLVTMAILILGVPHRARCTRRSSDPSTISASPLRNGARSPVAGFLPVHHRQHLRSLRRRQARPYGEYGRSGSQRVPVQVFDPRARWLLDHQEARPYGTAPILSESAGGEGEAAAAGGTRAGAPGAGRGQAPSQQPPS